VPGGRPDPHGPRVPRPLAMHQENELSVPERVSANFRVWLAEQEKDGTGSPKSSVAGSSMIRDHVAANLTIEPDDFEYAAVCAGGWVGEGAPVVRDDWAGS